MTSKSNRFEKTFVSVWFSRIVTLSIAVVGIVAVSGLLGYFPGLRIIGSIRPDYIPMAPSTACSFLILSAVLFLKSRKSLHTPSFWTMAGSTLLVIIFALLDVWGSFVGMDLNFEGHLTSRMGNLGEFPIGQMSPITALTFIVAGLGTLFLLLRSIKSTFSQSLEDLASIGGILILLAGATILLAYLYGTPLLYSGSIIPMAATTAISFFFLGAALVAAAGPRSFPLCRVIGNSTSAKLSRAFIPLAMAVVFIQSVLTNVVSSSPSANYSFYLAILIIFVGAITAFVVASVARSIGSNLDELARKLRLSDEQLAAFMDSATDGFILFDSEFYHLEMNKAALEITGLTRKDVIGKNLVEVLPDIKETPRYDAYKKVMETGVPYQITDLTHHPLTGDKHIELKVFKVGEGLGIIFTDITERKQIEASLKESEEKTQLIINTSPIGICTVDPLGNFTTTNLAYERMVGYSKEECRSLSFFDVTHPNDRPKNKELFQSMFTLEATGFSMKKRYVRKNGSEIDVTVHAVGIMDAEGNARFGTAFVEDITERKQIEEDVKKNQILLQQAEEISNQGAWEWDIVQNEWTFSENWLRIHGCQLSGITREELMTIAYPEDAPEVEKAFQDAVKGGTPYDIEHRIVRQNDSEVRYVRAKGNLILNDSGQPVKMYGVAQDITDSKLAEEALRESEAKLNALFTSLTEIVVMHELVLNDAGEAIDYRIIDCNKVFTEFTGIRKEDAIGKLASEVYQTDPPPYLEKYAKVGLEGEPHEFTTYYPSLDKHLMISAVSPQAGKFATITTDISDMMQIQEMIMAKNKEMENYLYVASHDLRAPLVNIQGFSQRLKNQADSIKALFADKTLEPETLHQLSTITDENIPKALSFILSNIEKMDTLISGLLQLSRTGRVGMNIQKIDMNKLFAKILQSLDFQIKETKCEIHIDPLPECYGDAALLDQVFVNIISNALKYSDSDRALKITVDAKQIYNKVVYTIRDTGKGIAQKHLDKIWDVFYRVDPRSGKTGEGIGLSLVKRITEKHKGKVWAESEENKGTVFYIELQNRSFTEF